MSGPAVNRDNPGRRATFRRPGHSWGIRPSAVLPRAGVTGAPILKGVPRQPPSRSDRLPAPGAQTATPATDGAA
ncbi:MAG TPA: hypothetical protein VHX39_12355 [Acetobacteraceae bacterium]|nr:hypothetical protein [Acetobacteraceae bacterium]